MLKGTRKYWLIALICGLIAAFLFYQYLQQLKADNQPADLVKVVVAGQNIKKDSILSGKQLKVIEIPGKYAAPDSIHDKDKVAGKVAIMDIAANEAILPEKLLSHANNEKLSYSVPVSRRAVAIPVDAVSGVAGDIKTGDRVDIIGTIDINSSGSAASYSIYTLQDIPVLAVKGGDAKTSTKSTIVLSVAPQELQKLVLISEKGTFRLALRSPVDKSKVVLPPVRPEDLLH